MKHRLDCTEIDELDEIVVGPRLTPPVGRVMNNEQGRGGNYRTMRYWAGFRLRYPWPLPGVAPCHETQAFCGFGGAGLLSA